MGNYASHEKLYYKINDSGLKEYYDIYNDQKINISLMPDATIALIKQLPDDVNKAKQTVELYNKINSNLEIIKQSTSKYNNYQILLSEYKDKDKPDNYYYKNQNNKKIFYFKLTNQIIALDNKKFKNKISQLDRDNLQKIENLSDFIAIEEYIIETRSKENNRLLSKIKNFGIADYQTVLLNWQSYINNIPNQRSYIDNILNDTNYCKDFLDSLYIYSKKDWKMWLLLNHPDKNPNTNKEICSKVIEYGNILYGS